MFKKILLSTALIATFFSSSLVFAEEDIKLQQNDFDLTSDYEAMSKLFKEQFGDFPTTWDEQYFNEIKNKCITKGDYTDCYTLEKPYRKGLWWYRYYKGDKQTGQVGKYYVEYYSDKQEPENENRLFLFIIALEPSNNNTYWWNEASFTFDHTKIKKDSLSRAELATAPTWGKSLRTKYQIFSFNDNKNYLQFKISSNGINEDKTTNISFDFFNPLTNRFYKIDRKVEAVDLDTYDVDYLDYTYGIFYLKSKTNNEKFVLDNYDHITEYGADWSVKQEFDVVWKNSRELNVGKLIKNLVLKNWISYDDNNQVKIQASFDDNGQLIEGFRVNNGINIAFTAQEEERAQKYLQENLKDFSVLGGLAWANNPYHFFTEDF